MELVGSKDIRDIAELQWRISIILMIPVIALMAIPLSRVNPRQGRFTRLVPGMIICFLYIISLSSARSSLASKNMPIEVGMWWVHGIFILITYGIFRMGWFISLFTRFVDRIRSTP